MKFYIDDHHSISSDRYMRLSDEERAYYDKLAREACERDNALIHNGDDEDMYIKNLGDELRMISLGDLLCKIQDGMNHGEECVLRMLVNNRDTIKCPYDHDCNKCIQTIINQRLDK